MEERVSAAGNRSGQMIETYSGTGLLILWVVFASVALAAIIAVLVWAVRSGQFSNQDAARYLPLKSGIPGSPTDADAGGREPRVSP
jgi:nitrogen fixation-related uncharacterized protein